MAGVGGAAGAAASAASAAASAGSTPSSGNNKGFVAGLKVLLDSDSLKNGEKQIKSFSNTAKSLLAKIGVVMTFNEIRKITEEFQQLNLQLIAVAGNVENANKMQQEMLQTAQDTNTAYSTLQSSVLSLVTTNSAVWNDENANRFLQTVREIAKTTGVSDSGISQLESTFQSITQAGRVTSSDMQTILRTAPELATKLANAFGFASANSTEFKAMLDSSMISVVDLQKAMSTLDADADEAMGNYKITISDALTYIKDGWGTLLGDSEVKDALEDIAKMMERLWDALEPILKQAIIWIDQIFNKIEQLVEANGGLEATIEKLGQALVAAFSINMLTKFLNMIYTIIAVINPALAPLMAVLGIATNLIGAGLTAATVVDTTKNGDDSIGGKFANWVSDKLGLSDLSSETEITSTYTNGFGESDEAESGTSSDTETESTSTSTSTGGGFGGSASDNESDYLDGSNSVLFKSMVESNQISADDIAKALENGDISSKSDAESYIETIAKIKNMSDEEKQEAIDSLSDNSVSTDSGIDFSAYEQTGQADVRKEQAEYIASMRGSVNSDLSSLNTGRTRFSYDYENGKIVSTTNPYATVGNKTAVDINNALTDTEAQKSAQESISLLTENMQEVSNMANTVMEKVSGIGSDITAGNDSAMEDVKATMREYNDAFQDMVKDNQLTIVDTVGKKWKQLGKDIVGVLDDVSDSTESISAAATEFYNTTSAHSTLSGFTAEQKEANDNVTKSQKDSSESDTTATEDTTELTKEYTTTAWQEINKKLKEAIYGTNASEAPDIEGVPKDDNTVKILQDAYDAFMKDHKDGYKPEDLANYINEALEKAFGKLSDTTTAYHPDSATIANNYKEMQTDASMKTSSILSGLSNSDISTLANLGYNMKSVTAALGYGTLGNDRKITSDEIPELKQLSNQFSTSNSTVTQNHYITFNNTYQGADQQSISESSTDMETKFADWLTSFTKTYATAAE